MDSRIPPLLSSPLRNWRSFLPAWLLLPFLPQILLRGTNEDRLLLYFWLIVAPLFAAAFWPLVRLYARGEISLLDFNLWILAVPMCAAAVIYYVQQLL